MRDWLADRAAATPGALALIDTETDTQWSYSGLNAAVDETAGRLAALGVAAGDQVGMLTTTRFKSVCLVHAAQRLGVQLVPLNTRLTSGELAAQLDQVDLTLLVCDAETERFAKRASESTADTARMPIASVDDPESATIKSFREVDPDSIESVDWAFDDPQLIVFTSGTTGSPKAVVLTMGNLLASAVASGFRLGIDPNDRWLVTLGLYHVGGLAPLFRSTLYGTAVVLRSSFDPGPTADDIGRYDVTVASLVPTMLSAMLDRRGTLSDSLRAVLLGGAPAPASLIERCRNYSVRVYPTYGMTEAASQIATARPETAFSQPASVGRPLLWTDLTLIDDTGEPVDSGESGEIVIDGPTVSPGYYNTPEATAAARCEYGFRTGDVGSFTELGLLVVHNRLDDRILTGGENVDPGEVRDVIRTHPAVVEAAVVGLADETWGQRVAAFVVPTDSGCSVAEFDAHCRERLAGYKLPRTIAFGDALPRTASGTIDRDAVRQRLKADGVATSGADRAPSGDDEIAGRDTAVDDVDTGRDADAGRDADSNTDGSAVPSSSVGRQRPPVATDETPATEEGSGTNTKRDDDDPPA